MVSATPISSKDFITFGINISKDIIVVNTTQCKWGVNMHYYRTGKELLKHHVISTKQMTFEAIYTKLFYLFQVFGVYKPAIVQLFQMNIAGELVKEPHYNKNIKRSFKNYQEL